MDPAQPPELPSIGPFRRAAYLALGGFFFVVGAIGVVLPGLPTTPFLLLTSYFLIRSSPRLHAALLRSRWFGPLLRDWQEHRAVRRVVKLQAIALIVVFLGIAVFLSGAPDAARWLTFGLGLVGITVVTRLPELPRKPRDLAPPDPALEDE